MKLHMQSDNSVTLIDNSFIDKYMSSANGEFVKLYIYLLRCAGTGTELSVSSIADFFDHTEKDVRRALSYWEKLGVLRLSYDEAGNITDVLFCSGAEGESLPDEAGQPHDFHEESDDVQIPSRASLSTSRRRQLKEEEDIQLLVYVAQKYFGRVLSSTELNNILYFYDGLDFSYDLIEYLLEYCASKGNPGAKYMEKVALEWYREGITTVTQARRQASQYNRDYYQIFTALGIKGRAPVSGEVAYMDRWLREWSMPMDVILEACSRTVMQTHESSFQYADSILKSWHENGVASMEDIAGLDARRESGLASGSKIRRIASAGKGTGTRTKTTNRFNNFRQRDYDYDRLEQELLKAQSGQDSESAGSV